MCAEGVVLVVSVVVLVSVGGRGGVYCYAAVRSSSKYARRMRGECGSFLVASLVRVAADLSAPLLSVFSIVFSACASVLCVVLCVSVSLVGRGVRGSWV